MINTIISYSIKNKLMVGLFTLTLIGLGIYSISTINLGSVPDITNNQVQVMTVSENLATEDIEQFITYPVERAMGNLPGVKEVRSVSRFGLSVVTVVFDDDQGIYLPRQLVQEKLNEVRDVIPENLGKPSLGPITTGLGEIYQYTISPKEGYDSAFTLTELRTVQDWIVSRQLTLIDGVVGVNAFGGKIKQYEIAIQPDKLNAHNVTISEIFEALENNNSNSGGAYIEKNNMANFIRGEGLIRSLDDIRQIVVKNENGIPVTIGDVASKVHFGHQVRYGAFTKDGAEAVGGMVLMLKGSNPNQVINDVKERMKKVQKSLPEGLEIKPFLDRSELIARTTDTVKTNLLEGALIVIFALVLLLGSLRGGIITATTIPLSLLFAFILMKLLGVWANLMSLGAIDFGIIIDGAVIIIEGTVYEIQKRVKSGKLKFNQNQMDKVALDSGSTMMKSAFFGQIIILIVFTPILFLTGVEGKMFQPMAYTFGFAMIGAIVLCLTYVPVMSALFMKPVTNPNSRFGKIEQALENFSGRIINGIHSVYLPFLNGALKLKKLVLLIALFLLGIAGYIFYQMGGEFIPQLDEGDIAMQALVRPGSTIDQSIETSKKIENILLEKFPEIETVLARIGVADIPTDPMPMDIADMFIILDKDRDNWVSADSKPSLIKKIKEELDKQLTGVNLVFSQPVELRFNELLTGVREDVAIKLYGEDLTVLARKKNEMARLIKTIPGVGDVSPERTSGLPQINIDYDRNKIAQYGVDINKLNTYVSTAFAGGITGVIFEGEKRFNMVVRLEKGYRQNIEDVRNLYIDLPNHKQIPLKELADIEYEPGPMQISRENTFRRTYIGVNTRDRDVENVVTDIQTKLDAKLNLPPGYYISYGGEFENLKRAKNRLTIVVPIALFLIFILLYLALNSISQCMMIYMAIPLAAIGGVIALWLRDMPFSISAGVGFIVLFGVAVLNGLVLINRFNSLEKEGVTKIKERILIGTKERIRPIMLTATTDIFGFLPMAFSNSAGAEVQRPLATVVIGGMLSATLLTLLILPIFYSIMETRKHKKMKASKLNVGIVLIVFASLWALPTETKAQKVDPDQLPSISIERAKQMARENYPAIKSAELSIEKQQALKKTAWDLGTTRLITGAEEVGDNRGVYTTIGVQQQNMDIFGIAPRIKLQQEKTSMARTALNLSLLELEREVSMAWSEAFTYKNKYHLYRSLDSLFSDISKAAKVNLDTKNSSKLEYLSTANQANTIQIQKQKAYHDNLIALQQLNRWLGTDSTFTVATLPLSELTEPIGYLSDTLGGHTGLELSKQQIAITDAKVKEAKSDFLPQLQGQYGKQRISGQSGFYQFQLGISIPLFFGPEKGRTQSAQLDQKIAHQKYKEKQLQLNTEYQTTRELYLKWLNTWQYYQKEVLPLAEKQQQGAIAAYQEGAIDYISFLQTLRDASNLKMEAWDAFGHFMKSKYQLKYYLETKN